jgi:hypothetical protein
MSQYSHQDLAELKRHLEQGTFKIRIEGVKEDTDGSATVSFEATDEFIDWFKEKEGLKRWSAKRFQKFFDSNLRNLLSSAAQNQK